MRLTNPKALSLSWLLLILAVSFSALSCHEKDGSILLQREWIANAEYAGDAWAALLSRQEGPPIEIREGSEIVDPIKMVRAGEAHFGVVSADRVLQENQKGASLVIIGAATHRSPVVFLTQPELEISSLSDLDGLVIGLQAGTNTELIFTALRSKAATELGELRVVESGWTTAEFETGAIDVLGAFAYDEPITLTQKNVEYDILDPSEYGVDFVGTVYFTTKRMVDAEPETVHRFMKLLGRGWQNAITDPDQAIDILAEQFPALKDNLSKENESLKAGLPYFEGEDGQTFYVSRDKWEEMANTLIDLDLLDDFSFESSVDYRFIPADVD